jgi:hypothetical protein
MGYRIPREQEVVEAISDVLVRQPHIRSQKELVMLVSTELMCTDQDYRIGAARIRRIGVRNGLFDITISYARDDRSSGLYKCPVCGEILESVMNRTLDGGSVELRRVCRECGYVGNPGASRPSRYVIDRRVRYGPGREAEGGREAPQPGGRPHGRGAAHVRHGRALGRRFPNDTQDRLFGLLRREPSQHSQGYGLR